MTERSNPVSISAENFLHHVPLMAGLDDEALHFLSSMAVEIHYPVGSVIIREGEPGNSMLFLATGRVKVLKGYVVGQSVTLAEFGPGEFFGEMSMVDCTAHSASVLAVDEVIIYSLKGADFHRLYHHRPDQYGIVILNLARDLARRLRALDERLWLLSH